MHPGGVDPDAPESYRLSRLGKFDGFVAIGRAKVGSLPEHMPGRWLASYVAVMGLTARS